LLSCTFGKVRKGVFSYEDDMAWVLGIFIINKSKEWEAPVMTVISYTYSFIDDDFGCLLCGIKVAIAHSISAYIFARAV
jgi:hypothetical protein